MKKTTSTPKSEPTAWNQNLLTKHDDFWQRNVVAYKICTELELFKRSYDTSIMVMPGLPFRQKDVIKMIEFYGNSKYLNGQKDELGFEKPFYNTLNGICDVENAAKDIDAKDITITSDDGNHYNESFLMTADIHEWMREVNFGQTLNEMRDIHTRYGSLLVKKCVETIDSDRQITLQMPEWKNVLTDQLDIENGPIVECHWLTPGELLKKEEWNQTVIGEAIDKIAKEGTIKRFPVYEVRAELPVSYFKEVQGLKPSKNDKRTYTYQLYYLLGEPMDPTQVSIKNGGSVYVSAELKPLYWENDTERVYKYLARKKKAGRSFGVGIFEEGEQSQIWTNDIVMKQARAMDITTKVIGQSASKKLKGRNLLSETDNGVILEHEDGKPITPLAMGPAGGFAQFSELLGQWFHQLESSTSAFAMQRGEVTTKNFRLQSLALQQSSAVFKNLQEDLGLFVVDIFNDWILPFLGKKLNSAHILSHEFTLGELQEVDKSFATHSANEMAIEMMLSGHSVTEQNYQMFMQTATQQVGQTKTKRFIDVPKDYYKKAKGKVTINITGEQQDKALVLEALMNVIKIYTANPQIANDPVATVFFMKMVEISNSGISPVTLIAAFQKQAQIQAQQQQGASGKVSQSMSFKDLPVEGQIQMAKEAGIDLSKATFPNPNQPSPAQSGKSPAPTRFSLTAKGGQWPFKNFFTTNQPAKKSKTT